MSELKLLDIMFDEDRIEELRDYLSNNPDKTFHQGFEYVYPELNTRHKVLKREHIHSTVETFNYRDFKINLQVI